MAVRTFKTFAQVMRVRADNLVEEANRIIIQTGLAVDQALVLSTPVDTGRARSNWLVSLNAPILNEIEPYSPGMSLGRGESANAQAALQQAQAVLAGRRTGETIYITNSTPYITDLNSGTSAQAPAMFVDLAIQAGRDAVQRAVLNTGKGT